MLVHKELFQLVVTETVWYV